MEQENIICFAKDWTEDPTSNNHVMRLLATQNKVLWFNSLALRTPTFSDKRDLQKIGRKLKSFTKGTKEVSPGLRVYTPIVLPFPHNPVATKLNQKILRASVDVLRRRFDMNEFQLWTFLPSSVQYVGKLGESFVVYYCTDEFSQFSYLDGAKISAMEKELCERADVVFTTSHTLLERKKVYNPNTFLASHGVDHAHFASALDDKTPIAEELVGLPKPVIGFFGLIQDWIDIELFAYLAEKRPDWSIVLVGKAMVDVSILKRYKNIIMVDRKPYSEMPKYCKGFSVGLCPFRLNELTKHVNPIKLREYFSAGLPVVSTDIPECRFYPEWGRVAKTHEEFLAQTEAALKEDSPEKRKARSDAMRSETWEKKVEALGARIEEVRARKGGVRSNGV